MDRVVPALAHLLTVGAGHDHHLLIHLGFGDHEGLAHTVIEALGHVAGHLQVLKLVLAHGHVVRIVQQDVGGHQHRVGEEARVHVLQTVRLVFETMRQGEAGVGEEAAQVPGKFSHLGYVALAVEDRTGNIQAASQPGGGHAVGVAAQQRWILDLG